MGLIDWDTKGWKTSLVIELFGAVTADVICQIPIGYIHYRDRQIWSGTANGEFTVISTYHLQNELLGIDQGECSHTINHKLLRKYIWKMNVPHVVKVFMWRACHNALATKSNLLRQKITKDPLCPLCEAEEETTNHVLWGCPAAGLIWSMCGSKIQKRCIVNEEFVFIIKELQRYLDNDDKELIEVVARNVWLRRIAMVHGKPISPYTSVVNNAYDSLAAFQNANYQKLS